MGRQKEERTHWPQAILKFTVENLTRFQDQRVIFCDLRLCPLGHLLYPLSHPCFFLKSKVFLAWSSLVVNNLPANAGEVGLISPGEASGNPPQYSCLGNSVDRGAQQATVNGGCKESDTTLLLNNKFY